MYKCWLRSILTLMLCVGPSVGYAAFLTDGGGSGGTFANSNGVGASGASGTLTVDGGNGKITFCAGQLNITTSATISKCLQIGVMPTASLAGNVQIFQGGGQVYTVSGHNITGVVDAIINLATGYVLWCPAFEDATNKAVASGSICQSGLATTATGTRIASAPFFGGLLVLDETDGKISFCNAYYDLSRLPGKWTYSKCVLEGIMPTTLLLGNAQIAEFGAYQTYPATRSSFTVFNKATGVITLCPTITNATGVIQAGACTTPKKVF
ncbi:MAG: hypothetical protein ACREE2_18710 [Stellaceae bacterium]